MIKLIKPVRYGILIGLLGLVFSIGWAFWLVLGHEIIHESLRSKYVQPSKPEDTLQHNTHFEGGHDNPIIELSHTRLRRGHLHAMGLGLVTIAVSFIIAFTSAPDRIKTAASVFSGLGGIIHPFAWIVMGYRTPALGPNGAEASVVTIAGPGVVLIVLGIFTAIVFLLKDIFPKR